MELRTRAALAYDRRMVLPAVVALVAALLATGAAAAPSTPAWSSLKPGATTGWLTMEDAPHFVEPKTQALAAGTNRSFIVAGQGDVFLKDGQPFRFIAGTIHYFRIHPAYWEDRLMRMKALGLTAVQVYVPWNHHEPMPYQYTFDGAADVVHFLELADKLGFLVILRPGPYICAEWDFGGFPWWLTSSQVVGGGGDKATQMRIRSDDPKYLMHVDRWWNALLPRLAHLTYQRGGPIIATQIENEFGFIGPNEPYMRHLTAIAKAALGPDHILFTTDPPVHVKKGSLPGSELLTVVDFGAHWFALDDAFGRQKSMNPPGQSPVWCSEFYTGWLTWWGQPMANSSIYDFLDTFDQILRYNNNMGSVTLYMATGGTNFGYTAGSQVDPIPSDLTWDWEAGELQAKGKYSSVITSYDYASPISEAGDFGQPGINGPNKFELIRASIANHTGNALLPMPPRPTIYAYGTVVLSQQASLLSQLPQLVPGDGALSDLPLPMEEYGQQGGLILYRTQVNASQIFNNATLFFGDRVHDNAMILVNGVIVGRLDRNQEANLELGIAAPPAGPVQPENSSMAVLDILVEGYARRNTGTQFDVKGLPSTIVLLSGLPLTGWRVFTLPITDTSVLCFPPLAAAAPAPAPALAPAKLAASARVKSAGHALEKALASSGSPSPQVIQSTATAAARVRAETCGAPAGANRTCAVPPLNVATDGPIFFKGTLYVEPSLADKLGRFPDSYLSVANGWNKGLIFINGYNIGPYWPANGPQETQYVPGPLLKACDNEIILLETGGGRGARAEIRFTTAANFYGPPAKALGSAATEDGARIPAAPTPGTPAVGKEYGGHMVMSQGRTEL